MIIANSSEFLAILRDRLYAIGAEYGITVDSAVQTRSERPLTIGVIGIFSTGKSTFLNALTKRSLLPTALGPKTAVPMFIERTTGPEVAELVHKNGRIELTTLESAMREGALPSGADPDEVEAFNARISFREVTLRLHLPEMFDQVRIIDTPGLNSPYEEHELLAIRVLRECDVVLYLLDEVVKDVDSSALVIGQKHVSRFIFLQTKVDRARAGGGSWDETRAANAQQIAEVIGHSVDILPLSAAKAIREQDGDDNPEWGMPQLRAELGNALRNRRSLLAVADAKRLATAADDLFNHAESRRTSLRGDEQSMHREIASIRERLRLARNIGTRLDPLLAEATRSVNAFSSSHIAGWREEIRSAMLAVTLGDEPEERLRAAALRRVRTILDRDAEFAVQEAVTLADGRALKVLYETFEIDLAGPLRGHPVIDVECPPIRRGFLRSIGDWFRGKTTVSASEITSAAESVATSMRDQLASATQRSLNEAFGQYRTYVDASIPTLESACGQIQAHIDDSHALREERIANIDKGTKDIASLRADIADAINLLEQHVGSPL